MNRLSYLQLVKENAEHFELAKPLWIEFNKEVNEHDGIIETDEEILTDLKRRINIQGSRPDMHFEIAFIGNIPIGISMFAIDTGTVYGLLPKGCGTIMGFYIIPEYRRKGYGKEFFEHIEEILNTQNSVMLYLTPDGVTGKPFWKAVGFIDSGKIDPDNKMEIYIKEKCLTDFNVNTVSSDDARYVTMLYGKNVEALHGRLISYSEWCSLLSAEDTDERHFLIRKGDVPCAYLKVNGLESGDNIGWISMLVVEPAFHRKGIGSYAVSYAEDFLRDMGKSIIKIHTTLDNIPAQRLYEKCGYILTDNNGEQLTYTKT